MKYLLRSLKYFIYLTIILTLVIVALVAFKIVDGNLSTMFVNGYDSYWQIALLMAVFALIYPKYGFSTRKAYLKGSPEELRNGMDEVMSSHGYKLEKEEGDTLCYIKRSGFSRALKMWEDRITFTKILTGYELEGLTRDLPRLISALEYKLSSETPE